MYATVVDDGARQTDFLADIVGRITQLPLGWAVLAAMLLTAAFVLFGLAILVIVLMVKALRGANILLAAHTPTPNPSPGGAPP